MNQNNSFGKGFSLIEVTIILFILGLMIAGTIAPLALSIEQSRKNETEKQIENIEDAILGFVLTNQRLPCPDCPTGSGVGACAGNEDDGLEDISAGQCTLGDETVITGNIPWTTLGVTGTDSWGRLIQYSVDEAYADNDADTSNQITSCTTFTTTNSFSLCSEASISINDSGGTGVSCTGTGNTVAENIPYVVFSHGTELNGPDASSTSCNETENTNGDGNFVSIGYTQDDTEYFDDIISWGSPFVINAQMVKAELLP